MSVPAVQLSIRDRFIYGLRVRSEIDLPGWPNFDSGAPDVTISLESHANSDFQGEPYSARSVLAEGGIELEVRGVGRYIASDGALIRVAVEPGAKSEDIRLYLLGAMMGVILHQRGFYPLHASCVALNGGGIAFAGPSGVGKSTLVASLVRRGASFVTDDICAMAPVNGGEPAVWPGAASVKLDESGLASASGPVADLAPAGGNRGKYQLPIDAVIDWATPVPLRRVYLIRDGEGPPRLERLSGLEATSALVEETYFLVYAAALGLTPQVFRWAAEVARTVSVSTLVRPNGLEHLPAVLDMIERDAGSA
jgi:hypothetical protein